MMMAGDVFRLAQQHNMGWDDSHGAHGWSMRRIALLYGV